MCWTKEVSMMTFILAIIGVIYLYKRNKENDRWVALFAGTVAMIQLAEYFMWSDQTTGQINKFASMFAMLILALEPMMGMLGGIYLSKQTNPNFLKIMLLSYVAFVFYIYFSFISNKKVNWYGLNNCNTVSTVSNKSAGNLWGKCHLRWFFLESIPMKLGIIWVLFLMLPLITMTPKYQGIILFMVGFFTLIMSKMYYNTAAGSLWCWYAISIIYIKILI
jgi:hypothetical protein